MKRRKRFSVLQWNQNRFGGEINAKWLQKIEELTLYLIEQNKTKLVQKDELKSQREMLVKIQIKPDILKGTKKKN